MSIKEQNTSIINLVVSASSQQTVHREISTAKTIFYLLNIDNMSSTNMNVQEFLLDVDSELRFEIETKNRKVIVEVSKNVQSVYFM